MPFDVVAILKQFGLRTLIILVLGWYVLFHQESKIDAVISEQKVTNVRLTALCLDSAGGDMVKTMACMGMSTAAAPK